MRYLIALVLILVFIALHAQYGTTYQFHFTLQDSSMGFNSTIDPFSARISKKGQRLILKTKNCRYRINSEAYHTFTTENDQITVNYAAVPPYTRVKFSIQRRSGKDIATSTIHIDYLENNDFAHLQWAPDSLLVSLAYSRNPAEYQLVTPQTDNGHRDLTCLLANSCTPIWEWTDWGWRKEEKRIHQKFLRIKQSLSSQAEDLITRHFPNGVFHQFFELQCVEPFYNSNGTLPGDCEIKPDTSLIALTYTYRHKSSWETVPAYRLTVNTAIMQDPYFGPHGFSEKKFDAEELNFLPPENVIKFAGHHFPEINFIKDAMGQPRVTLLYLHEQPQNTSPHRFDIQAFQAVSLREIIPILDTFAYVLQSELPKNGSIRGFANYYFFAHETQVILRTENYYDLLDE